MAYTFSAHATSEWPGLVQTPPALLSILPQHKQEASRTEILAHLETAPGARFRETNGPIPIAQILNAVVVVVLSLRREIQSRAAVNCRSTRLRFY